VRASLQTCLPRGYFVARLQRHARSARNSVHILQVRRNAAHSARSTGRPERATRRLGGCGSLRRGSGGGSGGGERGVLGRRALQPRLCARQRAAQLGDLPLCPLQLLRSLPLRARPYHSNVPDSPDRDNCRSARSSCCVTCRRVALGRTTVTCPTPLTCDTCSGRSARMHAARPWISHRPSMDQQGMHASAARACYAAAAQRCPCLLAKPWRRTCEPRASSRSASCACSRANDARSCSASAALCSAAPRAAAASAASCAWHV